MRTNTKLVKDKRLLIEYDNKVTRITIVDYLVTPNTYTLITNRMSEYKAISLQKIVEQRLGTVRNSIKGNYIVNIKDVLNGVVEWYVTPIKVVEQPTSPISLKLEEKPPVSITEKISKFFYDYLSFTVVRKSKIDKLNATIGTLTTELLVEKLNSLNKK